jgi:hypothetical protein
MNVFADINDIERKFQEYSIQFAVSIEKPKMGGTNAPYTPQMRFLPPSRGSVMPFRGGRFSLKR